MLQQFETYLRQEKRYSSHTCLAYLQDLAQFSEFNHCQDLSDWQEQNSATIRSWMVHLIDSGITNRSVNRKLAALRTFFKWLQKEGKIKATPMSRVQGPKSEKRLPVFIKEQELHPNRTTPLFSDNFEGLRSQLIVELFYQTGIRLSELIQLKDAAISSQNIKVLGKRNKERIIPISPELFALIERFRQQKQIMGLDHPNFFVRANNEPLYAQMVYRLVKSVLITISAVEKQSPHVLRHTFATHMLNNGAGLETLKDLLGHANLSATQVYTHNSFAQLKQAYQTAHPRAVKTR
ncbi:MAG: tyrosine-type recombinase/integrase [Flavobacteriales bacterium]